MTQRDARATRNHPFTAWLLFSLGAALAALVGLNFLAHRPVPRSGDAPDPTFESLRNLQRQFQQLGENSSLEWHNLRQGLEGILSQLDQLNVSGPTQAELQLLRERLELRLLTQAGLTTAQLNAVLPTGWVGEATVPSAPPQGPTPRFRVTLRPTAGCVSCRTDACPAGAIEVYPADVLGDLAAPPPLPGLCQPATIGTTSDTVLVDACGNEASCESRAAAIAAVVAYLQDRPGTPR